MFIDDPPAVLPAQTALPGEGVSPEMRLLHAVLEQAAHDLRAFRGARDPELRRLYRDAEAWIRSQEQWHPFAFVALCDALGYCADAVRERLLADAAPFPLAPSAHATAAARPTPMLANCPRPPRPAQPIQRAGWKHSARRDPSRSNAPARALRAIKTGLLVLVMLSASRHGASAATLFFSETAMARDATMVRALALSIDDATGIESLDVTLLYDPAVFRVGSDVSLTPVTAGNCDVLTNTAVPGVLQIALACLQPLSGGGPLLAVSLQRFERRTAELVVTRCSLNEDTIVCVPRAWTARSVSQAGLRNVQRVNRAPALVVRSLADVFRAYSASQR